MKLTKEIVNERIKDRGIELISEYTNANSTTDFKCICGNIWRATPGNIMAGKGCPSCAINKPVSRQMFEERIKHTGITLVGDYINTQTKTLFKCFCDNVWEASPNKIMNVKGCPKCASKIGGDKIRLSVETINERINHRGIYLVDGLIKVREKANFMCDNGHKWRATPDSIMTGNGCPTCSDSMLSNEIVNQRLNGTGIEIVSEYMGITVKSEFKGKCGHTWQSLPSNIMAKPNCPLCAEYGFNPGKPAHIYILDFGHYIKYGITNNLDRRLKEHLGNGEYTVALSKLYEDGNAAKNWERNIKIIFGGRFVSKNICPDGYTETLSRDKLHLLLDTVR